MRRYIRSIRRRYVDVAPPRRASSVVVELESPLTGIRSAHVLTPGMTLMVALPGYMIVDGKPAQAEIAVNVRAHAQF